SQKISLRLINLVMITASPIAVLKNMAIVDWINKIRDGLRGCPPPSGVDSNWKGRIDVKVFRL
ncbi:hypothetical protein, partial [Alistipes putredinis]|uniref:hypothetical protein n=1 Tax=Alistipes putredinis TaxID=28117 RepID=UPI003AAEC786